MENESVGSKQGWYQSTNELILPPLREPDALKVHVEQCFTSLTLDRDPSNTCPHWQPVSIVFWISYTRCTIVFSPEETNIHSWSQKMASRFWMSVISFQILYSLSQLALDWDVVVFHTSSQSWYSLLSFTRYEMIMQSLLSTHNLSFHAYWKEDMRHSGGKWNKRNNRGFLVLIIMTL